MLESLMSLWILAHTVSTDLTAEVAPLILKKLFHGGFFNAFFPEDSNKIITVW